MITYFLIFMTVFNFNQDRKVIFEFDKSCNINAWQVVDDVVMGGKSNSEILLNENENGFFKGNVSIENNGGFSSIRLNVNKIETTSHKTISLKLKGDGSEFQFRVKRSKYERHSYIFNFKTTGKWETIEIPLEEMIPSFRGFKLDISNFNQDEIQQIGFLKASKKNTPFQLEIRYIHLN
ncbi:CIA30 family protein [Flavobacteriaceae bacterium]|nr:CIA30 family protein [Flavobacteriaceae bacterium]